MDLPFDPVIASIEPITIPTYDVGTPEKSPMFIEKRVYQGSSGAVYPYPVIEHVSDEKSDKTYTAIRLENAYLRIILLPELGGRVYMTLDKTNGHHFTYFNQVIKPALVGLTGPWISGGIEFNWPQHHRPSTFDPVDYYVEEHADGSKTAWLGEVERMFRTKGMVGFRLHPDRAYLELDVRLYNGTPFPQTFLWWANPAVHVNDDYQSVFPPDVYAVMDHGKRDVSTFPIATGEYYKVDYAPGTDISRYSNIPVPTSYMAYHSDFDFLGCYDHGKQAGMLHVANHHLVPGKKQWTWGHGDFGRVWDRQLTDEDGPYIELMCGAFTDNQPDFSWLQPGEEKRFTQIFMPYKEIGAPKNANQDVALNLDVTGNQASLAVYCSRALSLQIELTAGNEIIYADQQSIGAAQAWQTVIDLPGGLSPEQLTVRLSDGGHELLSYSPMADELSNPPDPATPAQPPSEIETNEALFLTGQHLEQYRHATYEPEPYYLEALRRDPGDSRCNNAMGLLLLRRGQFSEAETYFRRAVERQIQRNPNPYDGEAYYNLGQSLRYQGRDVQAYDAFFKATWNAAWQDAAYFELARLAAKQGDFDTALEYCDSALGRNWRHHGARHLKAAMLRRLGRGHEAMAHTVESLELDGMNAGLLYERHLLDGDTDYRMLMRDNAHAFIELALDYAHAGLADEAVNLLAKAPKGDPMVGYYWGWILMTAGDEDGAGTAFKWAALASPDYCFPNRIECVPALETAIACRPEDARAPYYLGNFWYARRCHEEAIACWESAAALDDGFPIVFRNLGLAYMNKRNDAVKARSAYERAFALDPSDARIFFELDQLRKRLGDAPAERLDALEKRLDLVEQRDDLLIEYVTLLNLFGHNAQALDRLLDHTFHPWEGGEGKVSEQYETALVEMAIQAIIFDNPAEAVNLLQQALVYPDNLGEGKLPTAQDNHILYWLGVAHADLNEQEAARACFVEASSGSSEPTAALYYNDQPPELIYYQALAKRQLGHGDEALAIFARLIDYADQHMDDDVKIDYFAVSLPDFLVFDGDMAARNRIHCHFMAALGYLGLGKQEKAEEECLAILALDPAHLGATLHRSE